MLFAPFFLEGGKRTLDQDILTPPVFQVRLTTPRDITFQGLNGVIFGLIALDSKGYPIEASKKWTMSIKDWKNCISQFAIYFEDRLESEIAI